MGHGRALPAKTTLNTRERETEKDTASQRTRKREAARGCNARPRCDARVKVSFSQLLLGAEVLPDEHLTPFGALVVGRRGGGRKDILLLDL